ncbi:TIGR04066 family peptide maturation system protein [Paenibacillus kribbensis]|uniref:TIGR04066 family peptide maturation system protein n=1 Tax=Paenibacillus kribbensis TaxID=172713 RepID=UPI0008380EEA|nr:TIGR04066 family peptide maturation system protein [Paenibacillus kribbensis]
MKKRVVVFPYNGESLPLLRYRHMLVEFDVVGVVSPPGLGVLNKESDYGEEFQNIETSSNLSSLYCDYDVVLIANPDVSFDMSELILAEILPVLEAKKTIVSLYPFNPEAYCKLQDMCLAQGSSLINVVDIIKRKQEHLSELIDTEDERLTTIQTPVLMVAGVYEHTNKFDIQLCLRNHFMQRGYKISQIGTRTGCELFGFHSFPRIMFDSFPEWQKVLLFNRLCKGIEMTEKPDLILLGIPGGIMPYNNELTNKFGVLAFEIANAVTPDAAILSLLYEDINELYLENIYTSVKYKLGFEVDCFNFSNQKLDLNSSKREQKNSFVTLKTELVDSKVRNLGDCPIPVFDSLNTDDGMKMFEYLENKLIRNAQTLRI